VRRKVRIEIVTKHMGVRRTEKKLWHLKGPIFNSRHVGQIIALSEQTGGQECWSKESNGPKSHVSKAEWRGGKPN
jgi:hypothetical protein